MEEPLEYAIVRINKADNSVAGAGFLISEKHIMTCTHVIAYALGFTPKYLPSLDDQDLLNKEVSLVFAVIDLNKSFQAKIIKWYPVTSNQKIKDIAVLEIIDEVDEFSAQACSVSILSTKNRNLHQHKFDALGFPKGSSSGKWVEGKIMRTVPNSLIQIQGENIVGGRIEPGFSGTAIWDRELKAIVGMATKEAPESTEKIGFMKPTEILIEAWGDLAKHCRDDAFSEFVQILKKYEAEIKEVINLKWAYYQSIPLEQSFNLGNDDFHSLDELVNALVKIEKKPQKQKILLAKFASLILLQIKKKEEKNGILNGRLADFCQRIKIWIEVHTSLEYQVLIDKLAQKYTKESSMKTYLLICFVEETEKISIKSWFLEGNRWKNLEPSQSRLREIENYLTLKDEQLSQLVEDLKLQCIEQLSSNQTLNCIHYFLPLKLLDSQELSIDSLELLKIESDNPFSPPSCLDHEIAIRLNRTALSRKNIAKWKGKGNKLRETESKSFLEPIDYENKSTLFYDLSLDTVMAARLTNVIVREDLKDVLEAFLWAGIPLGIWEKMQVKKNTISEAKKKDTLTNLCQNKSVSDLLQNIRLCRQKSGNKKCHLGRHIFLLWDAPDILTPDLKQMYQMP